MITKLNVFHMQCQTVPTDHEAVNQSPSRVRA